METLKEGIWAKYDINDDYRILAGSLIGKNISYSSEELKKLLKSGEVYIYYEKGENGNFTNPTISIEYINEKINRINGLFDSKTVKPNRLKIINDKVNKMNRLKCYCYYIDDAFTYKVSKIKDNLDEISKEDLAFLYQEKYFVHGDIKIDNFFYHREVVNNLLKNRNIKSDLAYIYNLDQSQVGTRINDFDKSDEILIYANSISIDDYKQRDLDKFNKIKLLIGDINFKGVTNVSGIVLPETVIGKVNLDNLTSLNGISLPKEIYGSLNLNGLKTSEGLILPKYVGGKIYLEGLESLKYLVVSKSLLNNLVLNEDANYRQIIVLDDYEYGKYVDEIEGISNHKEKVR